MFTGISREICATAWEMLLPAIEKSAQLEVLNGHHGTIVVIDPHSSTGEAIFVGHVGQENPTFTGWAKAKAAVSFRTRMDGVSVHQDYPHLYKAGDIRFSGAVYRDGLVVGFSGVQGEFDEMISEWMISAIRGVCRDLMLRPGGAAEQEDPFLTA
jgi:hypothetical protein